MASLQTNRTKTGKTSFRIQFRHEGKSHTIRIGVIRESAAQKIKSKIEELVRCTKFGIPFDPECIDWLNNADISLVKRLYTLGICEQAKQYVEQRMATSASKPERGLSEFFEWYITHRKADVEPSTLRKIKSQLRKLEEFLISENITSLSEIDESTAFRFKLHRRKNASEATVATAVKVAKTAFTFAVNAGIVKFNPFSDLKPGREVNPDGQQIISIDEYEQIIAACPNSTWRTVVALGRIGGLRIPAS